MKSLWMVRFRTLYGRPIWPALAALTGLYALIFVLSRDKLIYTDEVVFAQDFARIARGAWSEIVIPHPPLYTALGSLATQAFGYTLPAMRLVGGLSFLAVLWLLPMTCLALSADVARARRAGLIAALIWAIHPLALQGSLLLDIDNTLWPLGMAALLLAFSITEDAPSAQRIAWISLTWALLLWIKWLPSTLLLGVALLIVTLLRRRRVASALIGLALGSLSFALSFLIFIAWSQFPIEALWPSIARVQTAGSEIQRTISRILMGGGITSVWIGIPFIAAWLTVAVHRIGQVARGAAIGYADALLLFSLLGMALYSAGNELPMGFPRYHYPVFLGMLILVSLALADSPTFNTLWQSAHPRGAILAAAAGCALFFALVLPDPLLPQYALTFETNDLLTRLRFGAQLQVIALVIPLGLAVLICWLAVRRVQPALLAGAIAFSLASWTVTTTTQTTADYATIYEYGRRGGREIGAIIASKTAPHDRLIAPKEILWAAQRDGDFVVELLACPTCTAQQIIKRFENDPPAAFVLTTKEDGRYTHITRDPTLTALLGRCYSAPLKVGSYLAYFHVGGACR
jgi:hypothetical protein